MQQRTYLTITPESRPVALKAAGKLPSGENALEYDPEQKLWFAREGADLSRVQTWLPENTVTGNIEVRTNLTPQEEFADVLREAGFSIPAGDLPVMDGQRHRVPVEGDKGKSTSGVYQGYLDGRPAGWYENHKASSGKTNWTSQGEYRLDPAQAIQQRALSAQKAWDRKRAQAADFDTLAQNLSRQVANMPPARDDHPYLVRKQVPALAGTRQDKYGNVVIPLENATGQVRTVQYINPEGGKNLKKGGEKTGNFYVAGGPLSHGRPVLYAEGYATAASLHLATGLPVVMTVDAGNLVTVSQNLKAAYPDSPHIICGEDDFTRRDNKGLNKALEAADATGAPLLLPVFTEDERTQALAGTAAFSDFNDIHVARGLDAVRDQLAPVLDPLIPDWRQSVQPENPVMTTTNEPSDNSASSGKPAPEIQTTSAEEMPVAETLPVTDTPAQENTVDSQTADATAQHESSGAEITPEVAPEHSAAPGGGDTHESLATPSLSGEAAPVQRHTEEMAAEEDAPAPGVSADEVPAVAQQAENGFRAAFGGNSDSLPPEPDKLDLDKLVQGLVRAQEGQSWVYSLDNERAFIHHINRGQFVMATPQASLDDRMVLAALLAARADADQFRRGGLEITGSAAFQDKVLNLIVAHNIEVKFINPAQREALEVLRQAAHTPKDTLSVTDTVPDTPAHQPSGQAMNAPAQTRVTTADAPAQGPATTPDTDKRTAPKEWVNPRTGVLEAHGEARYQFSPKNNDSYYVTLRTQHGEKTFWGKELKQAIADSGVKTGEAITLQFLGKQPVSINAPVRDEKGDITGYEKIDTERNQWAVQPLIDRQRLVATQAETSPPATLSVYDAARFRELQQQVMQHTGLPLTVPGRTSDGLFWLGPDGKCRAAPKTAPGNVTVPPLSRSAGSVVMEARDADKNLLLHLVKAHGDYLQGAVRQGEHWQHVLGKLCTRHDGSTYLALNTVGQDGTLSVLGHGNAVNHVKGGCVHFDTFAFALKDMPKILARLRNPEGMPPRLHEQLGFTQRYTPPVKEAPVEKPQPRPQAQNTMQPG